MIDLCEDMREQACNPNWLILSVSSSLSVAGYGPLALRSN